MLDASKTGQPYFEFPSIYRTVPLSYKSKSSIKKSDLFEHSIYILVDLKLVLNYGVSVAGS